MSLLICEEDFVSLFHLLLAPVLNQPEVEVYLPVVKAIGLIVADGRDFKVVSTIEECPEKMAQFFCFLSR